MNILIIAFKRIIKCYKIRYLINNIKIIKEIINFIIKRTEFIKIR